MKLRISGNSLRLRLSQSDLAQFIEQGRVAGMIRFALQDSATLTYAFEHNPSIATAQVRYESQMVTVIVSTQHAHTWAGTDQVGIYESIDLGQHGKLDVMIEKDFACLDGTDEQNKDTFPNPSQGAIC
jgi:hypothetical protein